MSRLMYAPTIATLLISVLALVPSGAIFAQQPGNDIATQTVHIASPRGIVSSLATNRFIVAYEDGSIPADVGARIQLAGARLLRLHAGLGIAIVQTGASSPSQTTAESQAEAAATLARLAAQPNVRYVFQDRIVSAHNLSVAAPTTGNGPITTIVAEPSNTPADTFYSTPQGWAVRQVGGFGNSVPGGPAHGPWDITRGRGVRIAILDSGVDATHPDLSPNLAFNKSEIDQSALPSPCDDGSPQDQQGHGTWTASLAAAAIGPTTGMVIGVAPEASILNIKVLQRMPASSGNPGSSSPDLSNSDLSSASSVGTPATTCATGQASGLLSWVIQGIDDALTQHADIISLSLGTIVDLDTGDGAGLKATFDSITYTAAQQGTLIVAAAGNEGYDLSNPRYVELPAQARDVLAVVATTNPACAEDLSANALCSPGAVTIPYYSNHGALLNAVSAPGGSYPAGPDLAVSGWIRGACSSGLPATTDGPPNSSTQPNRSFGCFNLGHAAYVQAMGTSASAPLVAGVAALLRAAHPTWSPADVIHAIRSSATTLARLSAPQVNAAAALTTVP